MTRVQLVRASATLLVLGAVTSACSSPTAPTRPPTAQPSPGDQRPPLSVACPSNQNVIAANSSGTVVTFTSPVVSGGVPPVQSTCTPASETMFAMGTSTVRCTATDAAQATASCTFNVTVAPPPPRISRTRFLAFGDSLTAGEVTQSTGMTALDGSPNFRFVIVPSAAYPTQLLTQLRARYTAQTGQFQVINAGRSGEWAEDGAVRLPGVLSNTQPEVVLLLQGYNDIAALGTPGVQRAARAIDTMARDVRLRGARMFLATLPPNRATGALRVSPADIQALNTRIRSTATGQNAVLVDLFAALSADVNRFIGIDGLHPTEVGYQRVAETFFAAIRADLER